MFRQVVGCIVLCTFVSGCAVTYRPVALPGEVQEDDSGEQLEAVQVGEHIRVVLLSGEEELGEVAKIGPETLTLLIDVVGDQWEQEIEISEIQLIEIKESTGGLTTTWTIVIVVLVAAIAVGAVYASSMDISIGNAN